MTASPNTSELVERLRAVAEVEEYWDRGEQAALHREAADRIEALESEVARLTNTLENAREALRCIRDDRSRISAVHRAEIALVGVNAVLEPRHEG